MGHLKMISIIISLHSQVAGDELTGLLHALHDGLHGRNVLFHLTAKLLVNYFCEFQPCVR